MDIIYDNSYFFNEVVAITIEGRAMKRQNILDEEFKCIKDAIWERARNGEDYVMVELNHLEIDDVRKLLGLHFGIEFTQHFRKLKISWKAK